MHSKGTADLTEEAKQRLNRAVQAYVDGYSMRVAATTNKVCKARLSAELVRRGIPIRSPKVPAPKSRPQPLTHANGYAFGTRMRERAYIAEGEE